MLENNMTTPDEIPPWVYSLGVATWVTNPEGAIIHANQRFADLFDKSLDDCVGSPCHLVVAGISANGETLCSEHCAVKGQIRRGESVEPYTVRVGDEDAESGHWLQLLVIPYNLTDRGAYTVHCAFLADRTQFLQSFLDRVAMRTPVNVDRDFRIEDAKLSSREIEVLECLVADQNLYEIAENLSISYYTVRNHVQHILGKMGVHSTLEAVALYLLSSAPAGE
jgi:DNA-binding CsgD family transcriptional regulator